MECLGDGMCTNPKCPTHGMTRSAEIPRKALLRAVPAYEDARVGGDGSTAAMAAALVAARP